MKEKKKAFDVSPQACATDENPSLSLSLSLSIISYKGAHPYPNNIFLKVYWVLAKICTSLSEIKSPQRGRI
jgi:hypothetical protein